MAVRGRPGAQNMGRMIGGGMNVEDFIELTKRTECNCECVGQSFVLTPEEKREDFVAVADEIGDRRFAFAQEQEAAGNRETACDFYYRACACYRLADYGIEGLTDEKKRIYAKVPLSFQKSYALSDDHVEVLEIPFQGASMPAYLALPDNCPADAPVLVFIPGATGFKEENWSVAYYFFQRGIPFIIFDGPGQGESLYFRDMHLTETNYVDAVKAVIDHVKADERVGDKVALYGISYGGFLAAQAACALGDDICGLVVRGGTDKTDDLTKHSWMGIPNFYLGGFKLKFGVDDLDECGRMSSAMDCTADLHKVTAPTLVVHSAEDPILGVDGAKRIYEMVSSADKHYAEYPGNSHCVTDQHDSACSFAADWLAARMRAE